MASTRKSDDRWSKVSERLVWPASVNLNISAADHFSATAQKPTLIVPDKDADGLSSGVIVHRSLVKLGLDPKLLNVHFVEKGSNIHEQKERRLMFQKSPKFVIVLDQGSRGGPPVIDDPDASCIVIDHHLSDDFPKDAIVSQLRETDSNSHIFQVVSACHYPPVATTSLVTYEICKDLHEDIGSECGYLCAIGTHGDLGNTLKWSSPFPDMTEIFKKHTKKLINDCVSLINARKFKVMIRIPC
jgi:single-stranded DNA-specific DHH superfamily exonuclease